MEGRFTNKLRNKNESIRTFILELLLYLLPYLILNLLRRQTQGVWRQAPQVAVTDASIPDQKAFLQESLAPEGGMLFMDKGYDSDSVCEELRKNNVASGVIMKNNRKQKNYDLDRWRSKLRMPFEGTFSKMPKLTRYRTKVKVTFEVIFQALVHNCKRLVKIQEEMNTA